MMKKNTEWLRTYPPMVVTEMVTEIFDNPQATCHDEIPNSKGEFGIEETNPIPVFGIPNNKIYLKSLRLEKTEHIRWERKGSRRVDGIQYPVDIYEIYNSKDDIVSMIYLSSYHFRTSKKAPRGFLLVDDEGS